MCLKDFKLQPKTPQISKKCLEAKFWGCFSQVQQVNIKNKKLCTSPGYLSIDAKKNPQADCGENCFAVKLKKPIWVVILCPVWNLPYGKHSGFFLGSWAPILCEYLKG